MIRGRCAAIATAACLAVPAAAGAQVSPQIGVVEADSGAARVLQRGQSLHTSWRSLRWSPGGRSLSAVRLWQGQPASIVRDGRVVIRLRGVDQAELAPGAARAAELRAGEDGVTLTLRDLATRRRQADRRLTRQEPYSRRPLARWSPDGTRIAVAWKTAAARWRLAILEAGTLRTLRVLSGSGDLELAQGAWSPDGRRIVFAVDQRDVPVPLDVELDVLDLAAPGTRRLARPGVWLGEAAWDPAGQRIALSYDFTALGLVDSGGGPVTTIELPGRDELHALAWSPDGGSLALAHAEDFEDDALDLGVMDLAARRLRQVRTLGHGEANELAWSPDGARIAYAVRAG